MSRKGSETWVSVGKGLEIPAASSLPSDCIDPSLGKNALPRMTRFFRERIQVVGTVRQNEGHRLSRGEFHELDSPSSAASFVHIRSIPGSRRRAAACGRYHGVDSDLLEVPNPEY